MFSELEEAAIDYVNNRQFLDAHRYQVGDKKWRVNEGLAWARLMRAVERHESEVAS